MGHQKEIGEEEDRQTGSQDLIGEGEFFWRGGIVLLCICITIGRWNIGDTGAQAVGGGHKLHPPAHRWLRAWGPMDNTV